MQRVCFPNLLNGTPIVEKKRQRSTVLSCHFITECSRNAAKFQLLPSCEQRVLQDWWAKWKFWGVNSENMSYKVPKIHQKCRFKSIKCLFISFQYCSFLKSEAFWIYFMLTWQTYTWKCIPPGTINGSTRTQERHKQTKKRKLPWKHACVKRTSVMETNSVWHRTGSGRIQKGWVRPSSKSGGGNEEVDCAHAASDGSVLLNFPLTQNSGDAVWWLNLRECGMWLSWTAHVPIRVTCSRPSH